MNLALVRTWKTGAVLNYSAEPLEGRRVEQVVLLAALQVERSEPE